MIHLTPQQLSSYMDGELNEVSTELVRRHMGACEECTLKFAALEVQEEHLSHALVHEPGDEFFERFAAAVERQLPQSKEPGSKRGASSPANRAAALREAARSTAGSAGFPAAETKVEINPPEAMQQPAPEQKPAASRTALPRPAAAELSPAQGLGFDDETDFDDDVVTAARSADAPVSARPSTTRPSPVERPIPSAARRYSERKATPPARPTQRPAPQRRHQIGRPAPSIPWYAAAILIVIAGAAGVMASRTDPVSAWLDSHGVRRPVSRRANPASIGSGLPAASTEQEPPTRPVPEPSPGEKTPSVQATPSDDEASPPNDSESSADDFTEPEPQAAERFLTPPKDPFADLPRAALAQVRTAQHSKEAADANPSAARYEAAAAEWERTVPLLRGARQQSLGRLELASSRYRAWENAPNEDRASAAAVAIRTYLSLAPQGAPRVVAKSWLARVSP